MAKSWLGNSPRGKVLPGSELSVAGSMSTPDVMREFRDKCNELAKLTKIPQVKWRLWRLAAEYDRSLRELDPTETTSIIPDSGEVKDEEERAEPPREPT